MRPSLILPPGEIVVSAGKDTLNAHVEVAFLLSKFLYSFPPLPTSLVLNSQIALHQ